MKVESAIILSRQSLHNKKVDLMQHSYHMTKRERREFKRNYNRMQRRRVKIY